MRLSEIFFEMATLQTQYTKLGLPIYVGPDEVYRTKLPHNLPRIKIRTKFGDIPLTIPQNDNEELIIPGSIKDKKVYERKIPSKILKDIKQYVRIHRKALTSYYFQEIPQPELKKLIKYFN